MHRWTRLSDIKHRRYVPACGAAINKYIVVIGGVTDEQVFRKTTEIYNLETGEWTYGPDVPSEEYLDDAQTAAFGDTFLLTGGRDEGHTSLKTIYEFDPESLDFVLREEKIYKSRYSHVAMTALPEMYPCEEK